MLHPVRPATRPVARAVSGDACIWLVDLDSVEAAEPFLSVLSEDERARAQRFVFDVHRRRFVACRATLRSLLAERLGVRPDDVAFEYGPAGKPALAGQEGPRFNVSHSDRYALVAVADVTVGIDIERVRPLSDMSQLAAMVFSEAERHVLAGTPESARTGAFFAGWTRKEAYIKAVGESLGLLDAIEVSIPADEPARLVGVAGRPDEPGRWALQSLSPVTGFAAAVCSEGRSRTWTPL